MFNENIIAGVRLMNSDKSVSSTDSSEEIRNEERQRSDNGYVKVEMITNKIKNLCADHCTRILLVSPPQVPENDFDVGVALQKRYPAFPPYGLGIINRKLKENGYVSDILDLNYEILSFLNQNKGSFHYRIWKDKLRSEIENFKPDIIGISCMFTMTAPQMYAVAEFVKEVNKNLPVVVGGVHPSNAAKTVLTECHAIDFVSLYEGDSSFIDWLNFINGKVTAKKLEQIATLYEDIYYSIDNRMREENINASPEYGILPIGNYHFLGKVGAYNFLLPEGTRASSVLSNRGCRGSCTYCSVNAFNGKGVKSRDVQTVVDEMKSLKNKYNITHFMYLDDDLLFNEKRAIELFKEIIHRKLNITWDASNGVVAASITSRVIDAAYKSGCIGLHLGIESGNPEILKSIRKPSGIKHFEKAAIVLKKYPGIFVKGFLMLGFLDETVGQILDTVNLALKLQFDWYPIQILTVFPETVIHKSLIKDGIIQEKDFKDKFFIGATGGQRLRETREKVEAKEFVNLLEVDPKIIPSEEQLKDIWFLVDYKVNYEKILTEDRPIKIRMLQKMLKEVCDRVKENPLSTLYLGIIEQKLGDHNKSQELKKHAKTYLDNSAYWQKRFKVLNLYKLF